MTNMTLAIPDELSRRMKKHPDIRWSAVARQSMEERVKILEEMDRLAANSKLTKQDALEIGQKIKEAAWRRLKQSSLMQMSSSRR